MTVANTELIKAVASMELPDNVIAQNVFYYVLESAADRSYSDILDALETELEAFYNAMDASIRSDVVLEDVIAHVWEWSVGDGWHTGRLIGVRTLTDTFGSAGDMLPHACAATMTGFTQDVNTRSRKSISGFAESWASDSDWGAAALTELVAAAAEWLSSRLISGSDYLHPIVPQLDGTWEYLLYMLVSDLVGSQRQRKPGEGI